MKIIDYAVACEVSLADLSGVVYAGLADGWIPHGGVSISSATLNGVPCHQYAQALIKIEEEKKDG